MKEFAKFRRIKDVTVYLSKLITRNEKRNVRSDYNNKNWEIATQEKRKTTLAAYHNTTAPVSIITVHLQLLDE